MPELPEVETWRRLADRTATGCQIITATAANDRKIFDQNAPSSVSRNLKGRTVVATHRIGKHFWMELDSGKDLYLHFGMTGSLWALQPDDDPPSHIKLDLMLSNGTRLIYRNMRRIGKVRLLQDVTAVPPVSRLGPDPIEQGLDLKDLQKCLGSKKGSLKGILLDQSVFAGVGNWIADEVLYQAKLSPHRRGKSLSPAEIKRLRTCLMRILKKAVSVEADSSRFPKSWLFHHRWGKKAETDARGDAIRFDQVAGRTTAWVPARQS
jgi:formamidopyrimidine-DNA glycosylase